MESIEEEGRHVEPETVLGAVLVQGIAGDEESRNRPGEELKDHEPHSRDGQGDGRRQAVGLQNPIIAPGSEIIAVDGGDGGGHSHKHGVGDLIDLHHHAVDGQGHVPAIDGGRAAAAHQIVQYDLHQSGEDLGEKAGKAQCQDPAGQSPGGPQRRPADMNGPEAAQIPQEEAPGHHLPQHRGDPGPHHAHLEREDENRIQHQVDNRAQHHAAQGVPRPPIRPDHGGERGTEQLEGQSPRQDAQIIRGFGQGGVRGAEEHRDLRGQQAAGQAQHHTGDEQQRHRVADRGIRLRLVPAAQIQADVGGTAIPQHQRQGID